MLTITSQQDQDLEMLRTKFRNVVLSAKGVVFHDGMESDFSRQLVAFIENDSTYAMDIISAYFMSEDADAAILEEILRWVAKIENSNTYRKRLELLLAGLQHTSPRVRDSAGLGLASMDDPSVLPQLEAAVEKEPFDELKRDLQLVVEQLRETAHQKAR